jgi:type VI secretion system secreted protein Hcp
MALNAYLKLKGAKQGDIKGGVTQKGREGTIEIHSFSHEIVSPRDSASGLPTGRRQHKPFTITKEIDKSTPLLHKALTDNETLTSFELRCFAPKAGPGGGGAGQEVNNFTITLTNASISDIVDIMENNLDLENAKLPLLEEVSFTYQKIEWTWVDGGITSSDDWEARQD